MAGINVAPVNVSQISDAELRERLKGFGKDVGPITSTTRGVLKKKLERLLEPTISTAYTTTSEFVEQKVNTNTTVTKKSVGKLSRASTGTGKKPTTRKKFAPFSSDEDDAANNTDTLKKTPIPNNGFHDDEFELNETGNETPVFSVSASTSTANINLTEDTVSQISLSTRNRRKSSKHTNIRPVDTSTPTTDVKPHKEVPSIKSLKNEFSDEDFPVPRHRRTSDLKRVIKDTTEHSIHHKSITKDSYKLTPRAPLKENIRNVIDESLVQIRNSYSSKRPTSDEYNYNVTNEEEDEELEVEFIEKKSCFTLFKEFLRWMILVLMMVILLGSLYFYKGDEDGVQGISGDGKVNSTVSKEHILRQRVGCLYEKLSILAGNADCGYVNVSDKWIKHDSLKVFAFEHCMIDKSDDIHDILRDDHYNDYFEINEKGDVSSKSSYRSLYCRINQALSVIVFRILTAITVISCIIGGYFFVLRRYAAGDQEANQILHYVERIIDILRRHHEACMTNKDIPPYLPIPHVRDMLIPLAKRKEMTKVWRKAVAFLNSSDSRIRVETQRIAGEDFDVWRWIGVCTPKMKKEKKATNEVYLNNDHDKCWQGPAFDEIEKVVRMPIVTPAPCLKIRYMHEGTEEKEPEEKWVKHVENAVLEKCNKDGAQILHIYVDKTSKEGCVYVKCDSLESAGKAFRCMYGNWFDCRLVIVKFVTLARYHQRFPEALKCLVPLQPDSTMPSSLNWVQEEK